MISNFRNEDLIKVQGKTYPLVGARLRLAHEDNKEISIETKLINYNTEYAVVQARIKIDKGIFNGLGNASIKRDKILSNAIVELAETRAIARALRFAGYGVEYTGYEEVGEDSEKDNNHKNERASKPQLNIIFSLAKSISVNNQELRDIIIELTGKNYTKDLTYDEAEIIIQSLKTRLKKENRTLSYKT